MVGGSSDPGARLSGLNTGGAMPSLTNCGAVAEGLACASGSQTPMRKSPLHEVVLSTELAIFVEHSL